MAMKLKQLSCAQVVLYIYCPKLNKKDVSRCLDKMTNRPNQTDPSIFKVVGLKVSYR